MSWYDVSPADLAFVRWCERLPDRGGHFDTGGMSDFHDVDPRELRVPPSRPQGADPARLQRQIAQFGRSMAGMPPPWVYEDSDGALVVYNGVTRATRIAKLSPGTLIRVEVVGKLRRAAAGDPKIGDLLT